jgi:hypothetical protein
MGQSVGQDKVLMHLNNDEFSDALKAIIRWTNGQLREFLFKNPIVLKKLRHEIFNDFWLSRLKATSIPCAPAFRFSEQPGIKNSELVGGYLLYFNVAEELQMGRAIDPEFTDTLSFHLKCEFLSSILLKLPEAEHSMLQEFAKTLFNLKGFAKMHGTPGYLLLANAYFHLAIHYQRFSLGDDASKGAYNFCWKFIHLSQLAENDSAESINNAYLGKGLAIATPFNLPTVLELKSFVLEHVNTELLPLSSRINAEHAAQSMYNKILNLQQTAAPLAPRP